MFDAFPFDEWAEDIAEFWTFGGAESTGTYIQLAIGFILMVAAFVGFVLMEKRKVEEQAAMLKSSGALDQPPPPAQSGPPVSAS
jgi:hypothetical protein